MSSVARKPFGNVDSNRIHQRQSKQPHHHRRRPQSKSTGGSDSNSIASLVDDSEYEFLSNPKPSLIKLDPGIAKQNVGTTTERSKILANGAWNSSSKTPKISNLTAILLQPKVDDYHQDVALGVARTPFPPAHGLASSTSNKSEISSTVPSQISNKSQKGSGYSDSVAELPSHQQVLRSTDVRRNINVPLGKKSHRRTKQFSNSEKTSVNFPSSTHGSMLETIMEGMPEEEKDSPVPIDHIESKQIINDGHNAVIADIPNKEQIAVDEKEAFENNSDMDESSDDDLMGLTLSPSVPIVPSYKQNVKENDGTTSKNWMSMDNSSPPNKCVRENLQDVPVQRSFCRVQQEHSNTPTQPLFPHVCGIAKKSTPHPAKNTLPQSKASTNVHSVCLENSEDKTNLDPSTLKQHLPQDRQYIVNLQTCSNLALAPRPPRYDKMNRQVTTKRKVGNPSPIRAIDPSLLEHHTCIHNGNDHSPLNKYQISSPACIKVRKNQLSPSKPTFGEKDAINTTTGTDPIIKQSFSNRKNNGNVDPVNKEVWQAVMGVPPIAEHSLVGLIIETPHVKSQNVIGETESIDGSELTHETYFSLDHMNTINQLRADASENRERQPSDLKSIKEVFLSPNNFKVRPQSSTCLVMQAKPTLKANDESSDDALTIINKRQSSSIEYDNTTSNARVAPDQQLGNKIVDSDAHEGFKGIKQTPEHAPEATTEFKREATTVWNTPHSLIKVKRAQSHSQDSFINGPKTGKSGPGVHSSSSTQRIRIILQEEVHTGILSPHNKHHIPNTAKPTLWTSEFAGKKFKALGVNAAPVFRLIDGTYYKHPPLPPGWTIAVSRSQNMPFYIHPDFGATFYSPVPLPSNDGITAGTTLLYQADTPLYPQVVNDNLQSLTLATPNVFGAHESLRWSDETSTVVMQHFKLKRLDTPIGALAVASSTYFSESQNEAVSNKELQKQMVGVTPASTSGCLSARQTFDADNSPDYSSCYSADSSTTVTAPSQQRPKATIPLEIQIMEVRNEETDEDRFKRDLENTAGKALPNVVIRRQSASESRASSGSADKSLQWAADLSPGSDESELAGRLGCGNPTSELLHDVFFHQGKNHHRNGVVSTPSVISTFDQVFSSMAESIKSSAAGKTPIPNMEDNPSPFASNDDDDYFDCVPHKISVPPEVDDMSLLQCSPQQSEQSNVLSQRYKLHSEPNGLPQYTEKSNLIIGNGDDQSTSEDCSYASGSYFSGQSNRSRVSCRSLNPKLPLCSLQYLQGIAAKKRTNKQGWKSAKRQRT